MASFLGDLVRGVAASSNQFPDAMRNRLLMQREEEKTEEANRVRKRQELFQMGQMQSGLLQDKAEAVQSDIDAINRQMADAYKEGAEVPPQAYQRLEDLTKQRDQFLENRSGIATRLLEGYPTRSDLFDPIAPEMPDPDAVVMVEDTETGETKQENQYDPSQMGKAIAARKKAEEREKKFTTALSSVKTIAYNQGPDAALAYFRQQITDATPDEIARVQAAFIAPDDKWTPARITQMATHLRNTPESEGMLKYLPEDVQRDVLFQIIEGDGRIAGKITAGQQQQLGDTLLGIHLLGDLDASIRKNKDVMGPYLGGWYEAQEHPLLAWARTENYKRARVLKAEIDQVRQRVGNALEGGVLRKEDEAKYKIMLATLPDDPDVALNKIALMMKGMKTQYAIAKDIMERYSGAGNYKDDPLFDTVLPVDPMEATLDELIWWSKNGWDDVYTMDLIRQRFPRGSNK